MDKVVGIVRSFLPELVLLLAVGILMFLNVTAYEIDPYSEFFHIQSARETLAAGHFWVPVINGHEYLIRPPLWIWIVMASYKILGVSLVAARIPAILCSMLGLAFTYLMTMELTKSRFASVLAASALATTWSYFQGSVLSTSDILTTTIFTAFGWTFLQWHSFASRKTTIPLEMDVFSASLGALLGLLLLAKGTVAVVLLAVIAGSYLLITQSTALLRKLNLSLLIIPLALIPMPWLVSASIQSGNAMFMWDYLLTQPAQRMLGTGPWANLQPDWLFYLKFLPLTLLPYGLLLPAILIDTGALSAYKSNVPSQTWIRWLVFWVGIILLCSSISVFHEPTRILPVLPPIAIMVGYYLAKVAEGQITSAAYDNTVVGYIALLMGGAVLCAMLIFQVVPSDYVNGFWHLPGQAIIETLQLGKHQLDLPEAFPLWKFWLIPGPFILLLGGFILYLFQSERRLALTPITLVSTMIAFLLFIKVLYLPIMHRPVPEAFARQLNHQVQAQDGIVLYSLHPDIKRVLFYIDTPKLAHVRIIRKPDLIEQNLYPPKGVMYGLMPEKSFFEELPFTQRKMLQINHFNWKWDTTHLSELNKFLLIRQPKFDLMKSEMLSFQSLPPASQQALRDVVQTEAMLSGENGEKQGSSRRKKRRRR